MFVSLLKREHFRHSFPQLINKLKASIGGRGIKARYLPCSLSMDIITNCNLSCPWCSTREYRKTTGHLQLSFSDIKLLLDKYRLATFAGFCGAGETFLHSDLFKMAKYAKRLKMKVLITTNGTLLAQRMDELLNADIDLLEISLKGVSDEEYETLVGGRRNVLSSIIANAKQLAALRHRPWISFSYVVDRMNLHKIPSIVCLGREANIDEISFYNFIPQESCQNQSICLFKEDRTRIEKILGTCLGSSNDPLVRGPEYYTCDSTSRNCKMPFVCVRIGPDGGLSGCSRAINPSLENGNVFTDGNAFNNEHFRKIRREHLNPSLPLRYECIYCENRL